MQIVTAGRLKGTSVDCMFMESSFRMVNVALDHKVTFIILPVRFHFLELLVACVRMYYVPLHKGKSRI